VEKTILTGLLFPYTNDTKGFYSMAFENTSAGVYDRDQDLSQRSPTVISSIASIVVESSKGELDWTWVYDEQELKDKYGVKSFAKYGFGLHCAEHHLGESRILVRRVVDKATARTAGAYLSVDDTEASEPVMKLVNFDDGTNQPKGVLGDPMEEIGFTPDKAGIKNVLMFIAARSPGSWSDSISVRIRPSAPQGTLPGEHSDAKQFYVEVFVNYVGSASVPVETFLCSRSVELDGMGSQLFVEDKVNANSNYIRIKNNPLAPLVEFHTEVFEWLSGGVDGERATTQQIIDAWEGIEDTEVFEVQMLIGAGYTHPFVHQAIIKKAEARGDAIAICDIPREFQQTARAVNYRNNTLNISNSYGTMYTPWVQLTDDVTGKKFWCPPSGLVAARYAYTDRTKAYHWAPAGIDRGRIPVSDLEYKYNKDERNALDQAQINIIRKIPGRGFVIFDQQTLQTFASNLQLINVRRLVNGIKSIIRKSFLPSVFNPNDSFERLKVKNLVDGEAQKAVDSRGINEFETICDERNNTTAVVANNDMKVDFIVDPKIPAKRVHLGADIRNMGQGRNITFTES
jgi:hypothetical protein